MSIIDPSQYIKIKLELNVKINKSQCTAFNLVISVKEYVIRYPEKVSTHSTVYEKVSIEIYQRQCFAVFQKQEMKWKLNES